LGSFFSSAGGGPGGFVSSGFFSSAEGGNVTTGVGPSFFFSSVLFCSVEDVESDFDSLISCMIGVLGTAVCVLFSVLLPVPGKVDVGGG